MVVREEGAGAGASAGYGTEPTFSSNPNVYFQRTDPLHAGMMY